MLSRTLIALSLPLAISLVSFGAVPVAIAQAAGQPQSLTPAEQQAMSHPTPSTLLGIISRYTVANGFGEAVRVSYALANGAVCSTDHPDAMVPPSTSPLRLITVKLASGGTLNVDGASLQLVDAHGATTSIRRIGMRRSALDSGWIDQNGHPIPLRDKRFSAAIDIYNHVLWLKPQDQVDRQLALGKLQAEDFAQVEARRQQLLTTALAEIKQSGLVGSRKYLPDGPALFRAVQSDVNASIPAKVASITYTGYYLSQCFSHDVEVTIACDASNADRCSVTPGKGGISGIFGCKTDTSRPSSGLASVTLNLQDGDTIRLYQQDYLYQHNGQTVRQSLRDTTSSDGATGPWLDAHRTPINDSDPLVRLGNSVLSTIHFMAPLTSDALIVLDGPRYKEGLTALQAEIDQQQREAAWKREEAEYERQRQQRIARIVATLHSPKRAGDSVCSADGQDLGDVERVADGRVQVRYHVHEQGWSTPGLVINGFGSTGTTVPSRDYDLFHWYEAKDVGLCPAS